MKIAFPILSLLITLSTLPHAALSGTSALWGERGERWDPLGRLPDFSYAGYHAGEKSLPDLPVVTNVLDFGAIPNDEGDDTEAFQAAIEATHDGALLVPAGRYIVNDILALNRKGVVLRGEGSDEDGTILYFPKHLTDITGRGPSPWQYGNGGLIWIGHQTSAYGDSISFLKEPARRGDRVLELDNAEDLSAGDWIAIRLTDTADHSLMLHLHNDQVPICEWEEPVKGDLTWPVRIEKVSGNRITLAQPLRIDMHLEWQPTVLAYTPVREIGVESLRLEFPDEVYRGHHQERGYNGVGLTGALNCWIREVTIKNGENGIYLGSGSKQCELRDIRIIGRSLSITTPGPDFGMHAHHGVSFGSSSDNLLSDLELVDPTLHDISVFSKANGNVIRHVVGPNVSLDHHRYGPFENLFSDINAGLGTNLYNSSGKSEHGPHSGARETFWNIRSSSWEMPGAPVERTTWGRWTNAPWDYIQTNVIPCSTHLLTEDRQWLERVENIRPADLYVSQLERRTGRKLPEPDTVARPLITPQTKPLTGGAWVTLLCLTDQANIHYTLDGSEPDRSSPLFRERFIIKKDVKVRARAYRDGLKPSPIAEYAFEIHPDNEAPRLESASAVGDPNRINLRFSEELETSSAGEVDRYRVSGGVQVLAAEVAPNKTLVILRTSPLQSGETYSVSVREVRDLWNNATPEDTRLSFTYRDPQPALLAHYPFDTDGRDASGNGRHATLHEARIVEEGRVGGAASLNGKNAYISLPSDFLEEVADFTFAAWVYLESVKPSLHIFNFNMGLSGPGIGAYMYLAPEYHGVASFRATLGGIVHDQGVVTDKRLPANRWFHVAVTLEGDTGAIYLDGKHVAEAPVTINPRDLFATDVWLGRNVYPGSPYLHGRLDEVRFYNHALDSDQIQKLIHAKVGEFDIRDVSPLNKAQLTALRELVKSEPAAEALAHEVEAAVIANDLIKAHPQPLQVIHYEGLVNTDPRRIETVGKLRQMDDVALLMRYWQLTGDTQAVAALQRFITAWAATYQPTGNDVNENKFYPLFVAYEALRDQFTDTGRTGIDRWIRDMAERHAVAIHEAKSFTNRYTKHLLLLAVFGMILEQDDWTALSREGVQRFVTESLFPDGTSEDLKVRDTLTYHASALKPVIELAMMISGEDGSDLYAWENVRGGSIRKSVHYLVPYALGEKSREEWTHSQVPLDRQRAAAGLDAYQPGKRYDPQCSLELMELASYFDPGLKRVVAHLRATEVPAYSSWRILTNEAVHRARK